MRSCPPNWNTSSTKLCRKTAKCVTSTRRRFEAAETGHGEWEDCCAERDRFGRRSQTVVATKNRVHCCGSCGDRGCGYGRVLVPCPSSRAEDRFLGSAAFRQCHCRSKHRVSE